MWKFECKGFLKVREELNAESPDPKKLSKELADLCGKLGAFEWGCEERFKGLKEKISRDLLDADARMADGWLDEFYDLCDEARVWLPIK